MSYLCIFLSYFFFIFFYLTPVFGEEGGTVSSPKANPSSVPPSELLPTFAHTLLEENLLQGLVVLVGHEGKIHTLEAYGEDGKGNPLQPDAVFRWASMTKPIVMVGLLQLFEQGHFQLEDHLAKYLPEFENMNVAVVNEQGEIQLVPAARAITMHDVMSYTAGFSATFNTGTATG